MDVLEAQVKIKELIAENEKLKKQDEIHKKLIINLVDILKAFTDAYSDVKEPEVLEELKSFYKNIPDAFKIKELPKERWPKSHIVEVYGVNEGR